MRQRPHARLGAGTTRSPSRSGVPSRAVAPPSPTAATTPTFSWPWMIGYGVERRLSVPAYCSVSPRKVCLSVPQMPEASMRSSTAPGSSASGNGYSRTSSRPGASSVAAWTEVTRPTLLVGVALEEPGIGDQEHAGDDEREQREQADRARDHR